MLVYTVECTFADEAVATSFVAWLVREHVADVVRAGAIDGEVVRVDGEPLRCEVRYRFASREAFATYERDHAPRLRAEGARQIPFEGAVTFRRTTGELVTSTRGPV
jgi:hypothetical protein